MLYYMKLIQIIGDIIYNIWLNYYNVYQKVHNLPIINSASIIIFESYINNITINQSCLYDIMYILTVLFKFHVNQIALNIVSVKSNLRMMKNNILKQHKISSNKIISLKQHKIILRIKTQ